MYTKDVLDHIQFAQDNLSKAERELRVQAQSNRPVTTYHIAEEVMLKVTDTYRVHGQITAIKYLRNLLAPQIFIPLRHAKRIIDHVRDHSRDGSEIKRIKSLGVTYREYEGI